MTDYVNLIIWHGKKGDFLTRLFNGSTRHQFAVTDIVALPLTQEKYQTSGKGDTEACTLAFILDINLINNL